MKKIFSLSLMATALLISGNLWAGGDMNDKPLNAKAQIGSEYYSSVAKAIADVPADGTQKTIQMIDDETFEWNTNGAGIIISEGKNILLDLNGKKLQGVNRGSKVNAGFICVGNMRSATLVIMDSQWSADNPTEGTGCLSVENAYTPDEGQTYPHTRIVTIENRGGNLTIKSGIFKCIVNGNREVDYIIDNYANSTNCNTICTIENGYFNATYECFRNYSQNHQAVLNLVGGTYYGGFGIVFAQSVGSAYGEINISNGNYTSDEMALVRFWSDDNTKLTNQHVNITGGVANVESLYLKWNVYQSGEKETDSQKLAEMVAEFEEDYKNVFNITGGTFATPNYSVETSIIQGRDPVTGQISYENVPGESKKQEFILPTILNGAVCRDEESHILPGGQGDYPNEITVVPLKNDTTEQNGNWDEIFGSLDKMKDAATIHSEVTVTGHDSCYHVTVEGEGAILHIVDGAVLYTDDGGIQIKNGGKVIVDAGGILRVGARGMESDGRKSIYAYSTNEKSAVISMSPKGLVAKNPEIAVILTSQAYKRGEDDYVWQYIGIPTDASAGTAIETGTQYIKKFNASTQDWENVTNGNNMNEPFRCYCVSNNNSAPGTRYAMGGYLHNKENVTISMKGKSGIDHNWNFLANSYMAPINLEKFFQASELNVNIEKTIWLYDAKTSSYKNVVSGDFEIPGWGVDFTSIAPLQGFVMCLIEGATEASFTFDYATCVWGEEKTDARLAPQRSIARNVNCLKISVDADEYTHDAIKLVEGENYSSEFDNGYDASKFMNDGVNIYAELNNSNLSRVATDNLNGTQLSFKASNAVEYTMTFSNRNNDNFVLVDNANGAQVAMTDGATYTFVATPNSTDANRFEIRKITSVVTGNEDATIDGRKDGTYLVNGRLVIVKDGRAFNVLGL